MFSGLSPHLELGNSPDACRPQPPAFKPQKRKMKCIALVLHFCLRKNKTSSGRTNTRQHGDSIPILLIVTGLERAWQAFTCSPQRKNFAHHRQRLQEDEEHLYSLMRRL